MEKLWKGRTGGELGADAQALNSSIGVDCRMYREDITGSLAHSQMLCERGIISKADGESIKEGLNAILSDLDSGILQIDFEAEDIHSFVEAELTKRIGDAGKRLHTARSRNDQVATDFRLYVKNETDFLVVEIKELVLAITEKAQEYKDAIVSGYTHLQRAQPVTFGHQLCAYAFMLLRDIDRLNDCKKRLDICPLGSCALAGTGFDIDRARTAELLGFASPCENSIDGVSDRDFALEAAFCISTLMTHLSRLSEDLILWCSYEFGYVSLGNGFTTGSSIMPQKKNADLCELTRGKTGRCNGNLIALLTLLKGLPLAYNKDLQEDKELLFDSIDSAHLVLRAYAPMIRSMKANTQRMRECACEGFINATDAADYLTKKGEPFRSAYKITGELVEYCVQNKKTLEALSLDEFKRFSPLFECDVAEYIKIENCVSRRRSYGGPCADSVEAQTASIKKQVTE